MLINFPYIKRDTPIHRLDPRAKLILLFLYSLAAAQTSNVWFMLAGFIFAAYYYSLACLKWSETKRVWYFIILLNVKIIVVNYFLNTGSVVQGVDLTHQQVLFSIPFIGLSAKPLFIVPKRVDFSVECFVFRSSYGVPNL